MAVYFRQPCKDICSKWPSSGCSFTQAMWKICVVYFGTPFCCSYSDFVLLQATAARTSPGFAGAAHICRGPSSGFAPYYIDTVSSGFTDDVACLWTICIAYFNVLTVAHHCRHFQSLAAVSWWVLCLSPTDNRQRRQQVFWVISGLVHKSTSGILNWTQKFGNWMCLCALQPCHLRMETDLT